MKTLRKRAVAKAYGLKYERGCYKGDESITTDTFKHQSGGLYAASSFIGFELNLKHAVEMFEFMIMSKEKQMAEIVEFKKELEEKYGCSK